MASEVHASHPTDAKEPRDLVPSVDHLANERIDGDLKRGEERRTVGSAERLGHVVRQAALRTDVHR